MILIKELLKDPGTKLTDEFLSMVLGDSYTAWRILTGCF